MPLYLVESPHTPEECMASFEEFVKHPRAEELVKNTVAGCKNDNHVAWTIASFADENEARNMVTVETLKKKMKIYPVDQFTLEEMKGAHQ
jgi:hypothetical protein